MSSSGAVVGTLGCWSPGMLGAIFSSQGCRTAPNQCSNSSTASTAAGVVADDRVVLLREEAVLQRVLADLALGRRVLRALARGARFVRYRVLDRRLVIRFTDVDALGNRPGRFRGARLELDLLGRDPRPD